MPCCHSPPRSENSLLPSSERGSEHIISFCQNDPTQGSPIVTCCWKHELSSAQLLHKGSNQMFQSYFCLGRRLLSCWTSEKCPVLTRLTPDREESCATQSLTPAEVKMFPLSKKAVLCPVFFAHVGCDGDYLIFNFK